MQTIWQVWTWFGPLLLGKRANSCFFVLIRVFEGEGTGSEGWLAWL